MDKQQDSASEPAAAESELNAEAIGNEEEVTSEATEAELDPMDPVEMGRLLEDTRAKADEHWEQLLRLRAEMDNIGKRHTRELENAHKFALERFVNELLGVRDSLELGHNAALEPTADVDKLREGTELTLKMLSGVMDKFGVEQIDPQGEAFDPEFHQAMSMQPRDDVPPNTVVAVVQKGYLLNGRLVRPAMVMVSQAA